jgi:hypothetical protein
MSAGTFWAVFLAVLVVTILLIVLPLWKIYKKAGKPGWAAIIPVYNTWVLFEITGFPAWLSLLSLVPFVNIIPAVLSLVAYVKLARLFGKGALFAIGMILLPFIFLPILAYGKSQFSAEAAGAGESASPQPGSGAPAGAFNPVQPNEPVAPAADTPTSAPTAEAPTPPAAADQTPPPAADDSEQPKPPTV